MITWPVAWLYAKTGFTAKDIGGCLFFAIVADAVWITASVVYIFS